MPLPPVPDAGPVLAELVGVMVRAIVDAESDVRTGVLESGGLVVIEVAVVRGDVGKVIGREGAIALALRTLLSNAARKYGKRSDLRILE